MHTHADKTQENKSQSVANAVSQKQDVGESTFQFADNRPEKVAQQKLQEMANNSPQVSLLSTFQGIANNRLKTKQVAHLQPTDKKSNVPIQFGGIKRSFSEAFGQDYESEFEPPKKRRRLLGVSRLRRTYRRNIKRKAKPSSPRSVFGRQQLHNYGYNHKVIDFGSVRGDFYKGPFGGQPYLRINKDDYGLNSKPKTNYDDIIKALEKYGNDAALAGIIINKIRKGIELPEDMNASVKANTSLLIQLTQFIEPHESRVPGIDKLARTFLEQIKVGDMTFKQVFNRKDGLSVVARAKGGGAKYGGQESGRTLVGMPPKKSDKSSFDEIWTPQIDKVADDMSDSSDEE